MLSSRPRKQIMGPETEPARDLGTEMALVFDLGTEMATFRDLAVKYHIL